MEPFPDRSAPSNVVEDTPVSSAPGVPASVATPGPSPDEAERRRRIRSNWLYAGFALGLVFGFAVGAVRVAWSGWHVLPVELIFALLWGPYLGAIIAYNRCPVPRDPSWSWRKFRLHTRTLMALVAYVALLLGMGVTTERVGRRAREYFGKSSSAASMAKVFREQGRKSEAEAPQRLQAAALLRSGKIPDSLLPLQKSFLRSLDQKADADYRKQRYGLIADTEERVGKMQQRNAVVYRGLAEYHEALASKYDRAQRRPWQPVAPDPPMPPTQ